MEMIKACSKLLYNVSQARHVCFVNMSDRTTHGWVWWW
jgi:hypothetical protein